MYTVRWIAQNGSEMLYAARDVSFTPGDGDKKAGVSFYIIGTGEMKGDVHCSIDSGQIYVMNAQGRTVADYCLSTAEFPHGMAPKIAA